MSTMLKSKTLDRICCLALAVMLVLTAVLWVGKATVDKASAGVWNTTRIGYEGLFDQSTVHTINIEIADWDGLIASAGSEEYVECDVVIDGERLNNVAIRAKGNASLSSVTTMGSEKYSFKIEFDHWVKGRLYNGLDKLSLNNLIYDATMMKDYIAYTLMGKMGVPSPLCSFAEISVNGEVWGLYLAVEGVEDGFMDRNNMARGELYKPDSLGFGGGRGNGRDFDFDKFRVDDEDDSVSENGGAQPSFGGPEGFSFGGDMSGFGSFGGQFPGGMPDGGFSGMTPPTGDGAMSPPEGFSSMQPPSGDTGTADGNNSFRFSMPNFSGNFNFSMGGSDVKLAYIDDDPDSYANIFDNAKTKVSETDKSRLISALKKLSQREDIEETVYTEEVIRYLAVHDFLQNSDSYTGMMVHNYYLYEKDGRLAIIPWDYNLAFGGMSSTDGTSLVNSPIDSPVTSGSTSDRPLIAWIFEDEEALALYHDIYGQFISECIESGWLEAEIARVAEMIRPYVEKDKNSFFSVEEFDAAVTELQEYCALRAESVRGQLSGNIPSTSAEQRANTASLVDGSGLDVSAMGTMGSGGGFGGGFDRGGDKTRMPSAGRTSAGSKTDTKTEESESGTDEMPASGAGDETSPRTEASEGSVRSMPGGFTGAFTDGAVPSDFSGSFPGGTAPQGFSGAFPGGSAPSGFSGSFPSGGAPSGFSGSSPDGGAPSEFSGSFPDGSAPSGFSGSFPGGTAQSGFSGSFSDGTAPSGFSGSFPDGAAPSGFSGSFPDGNVPDETAGTIEGENLPDDSGDASETQPNATYGDEQADPESDTADEKPDSPGDVSEIQPNAADGEAQATPAPGTTSGKTEKDRTFSRGDASSDRKTKSGNAASSSSKDESVYPISWWELGVYVLALLIAIAVLAKIPGRNR